VLLAGPFAHPRRAAPARAVLTVARATQQESCRCTVAAAGVFTWCKCLCRPCGVLGWSRHGQWWSSPRLLSFVPMRPSSRIRWLTSPRSSRAAPPPASPKSYRLMVRALIEPRAPHSRLLLGALFICCNCTVSLRPHHHFAVPPAGWSPGFDLNIERTFETKRQQIHSLQEGLPFGEVRVASSAPPLHSVARHQARMHVVLPSMLCEHVRIDHRQTSAIVAQPGISSILLHRADTTASGRTRSTQTCSRRSGWRAIRRCRRPSPRPARMARPRRGFWRRNTGAPSAFPGFQGRCREGHALCALAVDCALLNGF